MFILKTKHKQMTTADKMEILNITSLMSWLMMVHVADDDDKMMPKIY